MAAESYDDRRLALSDSEKLDMVNLKLDALARALGGPKLVLRWEHIEERAGVPAKRRTWPRGRVRKEKAEAPDA